MTEAPLSAGLPGDGALDQQVLGALVSVWLAEDVGTGDVTAESTIAEDAVLTAHFAAREDMVLAGLPLSKAIFQHLDPGCSFEADALDGDCLRAGQRIARIEGRARALLTAERTALNSLQHLSGIATLTRRYVDAIAGTQVKLLDTRKTIPGLRHLAKYASRMGGAVNHRMGLFDAVMIKDNHVAAAGSITAAVTACQQNGQTRIQVECDTLEQAREAVDAGATSLLLDNMTLEMLRRAVQTFGGELPLEASGGVTLKTVRAIAETGVDYISVGRITQSAPAIDIGMDYGA